MISLEGVSVLLGGHAAVSDVSVSVERGGWLGLIGPNGAGKSTLLRAVAGLLPYAGAIELDGRDATALPRRARARLLAYVPQVPLMPDEMTVTEYVLLGRTPYLSALGGERDGDLTAASSALERLDAAAFARRRLGSLSGGERQRVLLARALAQEARLLLLDEPTSSLDLGHGQHVLELVDELRRERGLTVVCAMHDLTLASQYVDALLLLRDGRPVASGPVREVLTADALASNYGASIELLEHPSSGVVVLPTRVPRT